MATKKEAILNQIDAIIASCGSRNLSLGHIHLSEENTGEYITRISAAIHRLAPKGSSYVKATDELIKAHGITNSYYIAPLLGTLRAIRADYEADYLSSIEQLVSADLFSDFMDMAEYLLLEGYKDASAVMLGGILEEQLRKLCKANHIKTSKPDGKPKKADLLNSELAGAEIISKLDQKQVTAWLDLRNKAAHGEYSGYTAEQVKNMQSGILDFLVRKPA